MVGDVGLARKGDGHNLLGLVVVERLQNELVKVVNVDWRAAALGRGFNWMFGQGVSWRTMAGRGDARRVHVEAIGDAKAGSAREWLLQKLDRAAGEGK